MLASQNLVSDRPPVKSLLFIILNIFIGFAIIGPTVGLSIGSLFYDGDLVNDLTALPDNPRLMTALMIVQGLAASIGLIVIPIIHITRLEHKSLRPFFPEQKHIGQVLIILVALGFLVPVAMSPIVEWNATMHFPESLRLFEEWATSREEHAAKMIKLITDIDTPGELMACLLIIALIPAIGEELVFRGMIQHELWRGTSNIHVAIWVSAFIFSAIHMQFFGFIPRLLLGALFGYLYYWSGNLMIPMFAHMFNNGLQVSMIYLNNVKVIDIDIEDTSAFPIIPVLVCLILTAGLLYFIQKHYKGTIMRPVS